MNIHGTIKPLNLINRDDWRWYPYFSPKELACSHCGKVAIVKDFLDKLWSARVLADVPFVLSSGYRCPEHDTKIGGKGPHQTGEAVDILCVGDRAQKIMAVCSGIFPRMGVNQAGPHNQRFIHIDNLDSERFPDHPSPYVWSY